MRSLLVPACLCLLSALTPAQVTTGATGSFFGSPTGGEVLPWRAVSYAVFDFDGRPDRLIRPRHLTLEFVSVGGSAPVRAGGVSIGPGVFRDLLHGEAVSHLWEAPDGALALSVVHRIAGEHEDVFAARADADMDAWLAAGFVSLPPPAFARMSGAFGPPAQVVTTKWEKTITHEGEEVTLYRTYTLEQNYREDDEHFHRRVEEHEANMLRWGWRPHTPDTN